MKQSWFKFCVFLSLCGLNVIVMPIKSSARDMQEVESQKEIQKCNEDSDCILGNVGCIRTAINKRYKKDIIRMAKRMDYDLECEASDVLENVYEEEAYCKFPRKECSSSSDRKNGVKCYEKMGQCAVRIGSEL